MNLKKINSVKAKLTVSILLLTLIIVLFVGIYFPARFKQEQLKALESKVKTTTSITASNISASVFFNDIDVLKEDLERVIKYNDIGYIVVKSKNQIVYHYHLSEAEKNHFEDAGSTNNDDDLYFKTVENITMEKRELGTLYIGYTLSGLHKQISEIRNNLLLINILILVFGVISSFVIGHFFTKPIHELVVTADEVKAGNFTARANIRNKDEMGHLAARFNQMVETLHEFYTNLENKVAQRTRELAETNEKLEFEVEERKNAEAKTKQSLEEKVLLLKEIHHRVKNNLQIISSLLFLQSNNIEDPTTIEFFDESRNRIRAMSLVHENLYKNEDLSRIDFSNYTRQLISNITSTFSFSDDIKIYTELDNVFFPIDIAIPLGLILNELITNTLKHAFTDENNNSKIKEKKIHVTLVHNDNIVIEVQDNGKGLPVDFDPDVQESLGMRIVSNLVKQIDAKLRYENSDGAKFTLVLPGSAQN